MDAETNEASPSARPAPRPRPRLQQLDTVVVGRIVETPDTVTLVLDPGRTPVEYQAGQFLTVDPHQFPQIAGYARFLEDQKGRKEAVRAYSMASAPCEGTLAFTVKEEPYVAGHTRFPPLLSPLLTYGIFPGAKMTVTGFTGGYVVPEDAEAKTDHLVHLCAGSGIVPNYSMLKEVLARRPRLKQTLLYSNKTRYDVIFARQLEGIAARHKGRVRYVQALTREQDEAIFCEGQVCKGRITAEFIRQMVPDYATAMFFICGPGITVWEKKAAKAKGELPTPRFTESMVEALKQLGVGKDRIFYESFG